ncbi:MAG: hypothetical protein J6M05_02765 [Cardiobacteriaceae bacterium]|nr:hypothetical protein [Cardiobacteriaceae bacterium]
MAVTFTERGGEIVLKRHKGKWSCTIVKNNSQINEDALKAINSERLISGLISDCQLKK